MHTYDEKLVSIIIPCRNEEKFIKTCLDSIIAQEDHNKEIEVLIVDGMSTDKSRIIIKEYLKEYPYIKLFDNPHKITPVAMNEGIRNAKGEKVVMVNAHSILDVHFVKYSLEVLDSIKEADAVGGKLQTVNEGRGLIPRAIPMATDSIFGCGGRRYRTGAKEGFVKDTLPYCLYRRNVFSKIGYIDEELVRDQDEEFNYRLIKSAGKIYFDPRIQSWLHIRPSFNKLWRQHFQYGYFKPLVVRKVGGLLTLRQIVPATFVASLVFLGAAAPFNALLSFLFLFEALIYIVAIFTSSLFLSAKHKLQLFPFIVISFLILHFSYGLGYIKGILDFTVFRKNSKFNKEIPITR